MKKVLAMVAFVMVSVIVYAFNDGSKINADQQGKEAVSYTHLDVYKRQAKVN